MSKVVYSSIQIYTDDKQIFRPVNNPDQAKISKFDQDALEGWSNISELNFDADKCEVVHQRGQILHAFWSLGKFTD